MIKAKSGGRVRAKAHVAQVRFFARSCAAFYELGIEAVFWQGR